MNTRCKKISKKYVLSPEGKFKKRCLRISHNIWPDYPEAFSVNSIDGKKYKKRVLKYMQENSLLPGKCKFVCTGCVKYTEDKYINVECKSTSMNNLSTSSENPPILIPDEIVLNANDGLLNVHDDEINYDLNSSNIDIMEWNEESESQSINTQKYMDSCVENIVSLIENKSLTSNQMKRIMFAIGKSQQRNITDDIKFISKEYLNVEHSERFEPKKWLKKRNAIILSLIEGIIGAPIDDISHKKVNAAVHCMEQIYFIKNGKLITYPVFSLNLLAYYMTGSKSVTSLIGSCTSSGNYKTITNWIDNFSNKGAPECPDGFLHIWADNDQVIGKTQSFNQF